MTALMTNDQWDKATTAEILQERNARTEEHAGSGNHTGPGVRFVDEQYGAFDEPLDFFTDDPRFVHVSSDGEYNWFLDAQRVRALIEALTEWLGD